MNLQVSKSLILLSLIIGLSGCIQPDNDFKKAKKRSFQDLAKLTVYTDSSFMKGANLDTLMSTFSAPFILSPSPEPMYDVSLTDGIKSNVTSPRNDKILITGIASENPDLAQYVKNLFGLNRLKYNKHGWYRAKTVDQWATPQSVYAAIAIDKEAFQANASRIYTGIRNELDQDNDRYIQSAYGIDKDISSEIEQNIGVDLQIPEGYEIARQTEEGMWLRKDKGEQIYNLIIYKSDIVKPLNRENIILLQNEATLSLIDNKNNADPIIIEEDILPLFLYKTSLDDMPAVQARGIWKREHSFMGGSFSAYTYNTEKTTTLIGGFYFAPKTKKRDGILELDYIIRTLSNR